MPSAAAGLSPAGLDGVPPTGDATHRAQREAFGNRPCGLTLDDPPEFLLDRHQRYAFRVVELPAVDTAKVPRRGIRGKAPSVSGVATREEATPILCRRERRIAANVEFAARRCWRGSKSIDSQAAVASIRGHHPAGRRHRR